jgi:hypothetical protein
MIHDNALQRERERKEQGPRQGPGQGTPEIIMLLLPLSVSFLPSLNIFYKPLYHQVVSMEYQKEEKKKRKTQFIVIHQLLESIKKMKSLSNSKHSCDHCITITLVIFLIKQLIDLININIMK